MARLLAFLSFLCLCAPALAEGPPTAIWWHAPGTNRSWRVSTFEDADMEGQPTGYPLTYLLDGDPHTAWAWRGATRPAESDQELPRRLTVECTTGVMLDRVRLMNGYNKSPELFRRNDRVVEVRVSLNGTGVKTAALADRTGWHEVTFPRRKVRTLRLDFTGIRKGQVDDLCISELALYDGRRRIDPHMPRAVMARSGSGCC